MKDSWEQLPQDAWRIVHDEFANASIKIVSDTTAMIETNQRTEEALRRNAERMDAMCDKLRGDFMQQSEMGGPFL